MAQPSLARSATSDVSDIFYWKHTFCPAVSLLSPITKEMTSKTPTQASAPVDAGDLDTPLKSVLNFRDVGDFVNKASGSKSVHLQLQVAKLTSRRRLKTRLLYRGARPGKSKASPLSYGH